MANINGTTNTYKVEMLSGSSADDLINGQGGEDIINGGGGNDSVVFFDDTDNFSISTINQKKEIPRLCRGDSRSLTLRGVHRDTHDREPPSTRQRRIRWTVKKA